MSRKNHEKNLVNPSLCSCSGKVPIKPGTLLYQSSSSDSNKNIASQAINFSLFKHDARLPFAFTKCPKCGSNRMKELNLENPTRVFHICTESNCDGVINPRKEKKWYLNNFINNIMPDKGKYLMWIKINISKKFKKNI